MTATTLAPDDTKPDMALPDHVGVSEVVRGVEAALRRAFPTSLWVKGEVSGHRAPIQVEHIKSDDESPARNEETVVTYGLRKFHQTWVIATWSQGWPRFGSAEKLPAAQTWRDGWNLAE